MGGTVSIKIRDCERINLVRELYHDKSRTKELFLAILKHGTEVEKISHPSSLSGGKTLYLAEVICYITKRIDPFMSHFFHSDLLELNSNALSQIVTAAFAYAVKLGGVKPRQTFVKKVITNHKFAEMKSKFFPNFLAALVYYDHLWELFDLADDNIDDDSIFLGEFLRARHHIEEIEGVTFLREVTEESWTKEFHRIDNDDVKDGWISFLEFARYASHKIISPEEYIENKVRVFPTEESAAGEKTTKTSKRKDSKRPKSAQRQSLASMKINKQPKIFANNNSTNNSVEDDDDDDDDDAHSDAGDTYHLKKTAVAVEAANYIDKTLKTAKHSSSGKSSFAKPKSMLARYNDRLSREENNNQNNPNRKKSLFNVHQPINLMEQEEKGGLEEEQRKKMLAGRSLVKGNRQTAFMARLLRDEQQIMNESEAAANMEVSLELSQELVDMRKKNDKVSQRIENDEILPVKRKHHKGKTRIPAQQTISPFSFAGISIHHVKPGSYAAVCEEKRLRQLETFGKPLHEVHNDYVDERVFSINNLNKVVKIIKARVSDDNVRQESSGLLTPRPRENSLHPIASPTNTHTAPPSNPDDDHTPAAVEKKKSSEDEAKIKLKFRNKIEKYIAEGQANNQLHQQDRVRPKSASSSVTKTSLEEFEKQSQNSPVQSFFNNYTDVDKGQRDVRPKISVFDKYAVAEKSQASASLALSSRQGAEGGGKDKLEDNHQYRHQAHNTPSSPYIDDVSTEPHLVRGKVFIDHGNRDQHRFGNLRFSEQVFNTRPRSGHFPSKHDSLQGRKGYELWDSKRNQSLQPQGQNQTQAWTQKQHHQAPESVPRIHTYRCKSPQSPLLKSPIKKR